MDISSIAWPVATPKLETKQSGGQHWSISWVEVVGISRDRAGRADERQGAHASDGRGTTSYGS